MYTHDRYICTYYECMYVRTYVRTYVYVCMCLFATALRARHLVVHPSVQSRPIRGRTSGPVRPPYISTAPVVCSGTVWKSRRVRVVRAPTEGTLGLGSKVKVTSLRTKKKTRKTETGADREKHEAPMPDHLPPASSGECAAVALTAQGPAPERSTAQANAPNLLDRCSVQPPGQASPSRTTPLSHVLHPR